MSKKAALPDAWDDDWVAAADNQVNQAMPRIADAQLPAKVSKAQLRAKHIEANKQIWDKAESPETFHFIEAKNDVPLKSEFKPALKVLSRKPTPGTASSDGIAAAAAQISLDDEDDSEEEARKRKEHTFAERKRQAQREREEKQKRYMEVRERLFSSPSPPATNPTNDAGQSAAGKGSRSRGRTGGRSCDTPASGSSADPSPARSTPQNRQLFDPSYSTKPNSVYVSKSAAGQRRSGTASPVEGQPIRAPRGPDVSGRGGFGFATRGARSGVV